MFYLSCNNVGLSSDAVEARRSHEQRGERNVAENLSRKYTTLNGVLDFLTSKHDFYAANTLVRQSIGDNGVGEKKSENLLKLSYGQQSSGDVSSGAKLIQFRDGKVVFSLYGLISVAAVTFMGLYFSRRHYDRHSKDN